MPDNEGPVIDIEQWKVPMDDAEQVAAQKGELTVLQKIARDETARMVKQKEKEIKKRYKKEEEDRFNAILGW